ncbi:MAG: phosphoribosyl-ATP diphosphatase [Nitrospirae bacterium]|nr:phosphoribosyl-ATP diphosphatase [Nitrospirota bacterium]
MERRILEQLYEVIVERRKNPRGDSYTCMLFSKGTDEILKKVGEEAVEVILAAKGQGKEELVYELSDLLYHILVLMAEAEVTLEDIYGELEGRFGVSGLEKKKAEAQILPADQDT